jgi:hypothetical protein
MVTGLPYRVDETLDGSDYRTNQTTCPVSAAGPILNDVRLPALNFVVYQATTGALLWIETDTL